MFGQPMIGEEEIAEVVDTLRSGWIGTGPKTRLLEERFAAYVGSTHALAVNSCTAGLHLALDALGIGPGDEVVTTPLTFAATANVILHVGATPVFADVDRRTMNLSPDEVERVLTDRTKAIIAVHMAGMPCEAGPLRQLADSRGAALIADAAHAVETRYAGQPASEFFDVSVFSFYATKNLTTGEGGIVTTNDDLLAERISSRRSHGLTRDAWLRYSEDGDPSYEVDYPGYKYNLTDLHASLGLHQLARIEQNWIIRERHALTYRSAFEALPGILLPAAPPRSGARHGHHLFAILLDLARLNVTRSDFMMELRHERIGTGIHFNPVHLHRYYRERFQFEPGMFPNAEWIGERTLSLPLSAALTEHDVADVVAAVTRVAAAAL